MIPRCPTCGLVHKGHSLAAAMTVEQVRHYLRELEAIGVPTPALASIREWAQTLRRCTCDAAIEI